MNVSIECHINEMRNYLIYIYFVLLIHKFFKLINNEVKRFFEELKYENSNELDIRHTSM